MKKYEQLKNYIERVKKDACEAENRPYYQPRILVFVADNPYVPKGQTTIFCDAAEYSRVGRRVEYRLRRNLTKHFPELESVMVNSAPFTCADGEWYTLEEYYEIFMKGR